MTHPEDGIIMIPTNDSDDETGVLPYPPCKMCNRGDRGVACSFCPTAQTPRGSMQSPGCTGYGECFRAIAASRGL